MRKKIFQNYLLVEVLVLVLCCGLFLGVLFQHYEKQAFSQLRTEANYIAHGMELSGESYLNTLRSDAGVPALLHGAGRGAGLREGTHWAGKSGLVRKAVFWCAFRSPGRHRRSVDSGTTLKRSAFLSGRTGRSDRY